jgi:peptidoglycan hydrolase-like protein with peptidoglycan-binding domain
MNKIKYFQQGGAAPQQDVQAQVTALVQAAMQGDQKATQTVNQILEAAKSGDQKAVQLAQMIQQVAKQMQGQAVSAKYGSKLAYLQSLKCGGKTKKAKKAAVGTKVCPECDSKLVSKAQNGAVAGAGFYRNWSPEEIMQLQRFLQTHESMGEDAYTGEIDGKIGAKTLAAIKAYQRNQGLKEDGMWGHNTNLRHRVVMSNTLDKGSYKNQENERQNWMNRTNDFTYANADSMSQKQLDELVQYYTMNPELLYSDDAEHARNRQIFHNSGKWGSDFLNQTLASLTPEERSRINAKKTTTQYKQDEMVSNVNKGRNEVAGKMMPVLTAPLAVTAGLPAIATGAIGAAVGGRAGETYGYLTGVAKANETKDGGYVNNYSDPVADRYGVPTVINDKQRMVDESTRAGRGMGAAIGGMLGAFGSRFLGRPQVRGLASYERTNSSAPSRTTRTLMRNSKGQGTNMRIGDEASLDQQMRVNGQFGRKSVPATPEYQNYLEGAGGNPSYGVNLLGMKRGGFFPKN